MSSNISKIVQVGTVSSDSTKDATNRIENVTIQEVDNKKNNVFNHVNKDIDGNILNIKIKKIDWDTIFKGTAVVKDSFNLTATVSEER